MNVGIVPCALALVFALIRPAEVPLSFERGVLFVHATVNGVTGLLFVFDPGAGDFITTYASERLGGKPARTIAIGPASIEASLPVLAGDPQQVDPRHDPALGAIAGSIGPAFLHRYAIRIDYAKRMLWLIPFETFIKPKQAAELPFQVDRFNMPAVSAGADGIQGSFEIDVRAASGMLFSPFIRQYGFVDRYANRPQLRASAIGAQYALSRVSIGPYTVADVPTWFSKAVDGKFASGEVSGLIGNDVLAHFIVTFDYRTKTIYFERTN